MAKISLKEKLDAAWRGPLQSCLRRTCWEENIWGVKSYGGSLAKLDDVVLRPPLPWEKEE